MKKYFLVALVVGLFLGVSVKNVLAGPPLTNLEGVGGIAFNPLAYTADSTGKDSHLQIAGNDALGSPRFGVWYVNLSDVKVDWTSIGIADTLYKRLEISYGYQTINQDNATAKHKSNVGAKLLLVSENALSTEYIPAVAAGAIWKNTTNQAAGTDDGGVDYYIVATKLIKQLPRPVLLSGGALSTKGKVTGVFGFDKDRTTAAFGNLDIVLPLNLILGYEYKQGAQYDDWKDADYSDIHLAWTPNDKLTLVVATADAGDYKSISKVGLGNGVVVSAQYAF